MSRSRTVLISLAVVASFALAACGNEPHEPGTLQSENAQVAETEGIYVDVDGLKYQVQLSKQLNPLLPDDRDYLKGVSPGQADLNPDEEWFAVFILAQNYQDEPVMAASDFEIVDTQENKYTPVVIGEDNVWAYRAREIDAKDGPLPEELPNSNSPARERQPNGALLLFKLKRFSLDNRPLELNIRGSENDAVVNLDV
jgi:hypothetical protein